MRKISVLLAGLALTGALFLVACSGDDDGGGPTPTPAPTSTPAPVAVNMTITNFVYSPATLAARVGQKVSVNVTNNDTAPHTFTIDGVTDTGRLTQNQSGTSEFTPSQAGTLSYYCTVHGRDRMSGSVTVSASAVGGSTEDSGLTAVSTDSESPEDSF